MSWFFSAIPYLLAVGTIVIGLFTLLKEWDEYKNKRLRMAVVGGLIIVGILTIVSLYLNSEEKKEADKRAKGLEGQVKAANDAQERNTKLFLDSFNKLSGELSDLQTQVRTEALQKKLATVETELQRTQKALAPAPKAVLVFSFSPFINPPARSARL